MYVVHEVTKDVNYNTSYGDGKVDIF